MAESQLTVRVLCPTTAQYDEDSVISIINDINTIIFQPYPQAFPIDVLLRYTDKAEVFAP